MPWKRMLAYVTGEIEESLLLRIEYLIEENRVLRNQIETRILLTDAERRTLAEKAVALGKLMADTVTSRLRQAGDITRVGRLGGLLSFYHRKAA